MRLSNPVQGARLLKYPQGNVYQVFGENVSLYQRAIGTDGHPGLDIVGKQETPILAAYSGRVIVAYLKISSSLGGVVAILTTPDEKGEMYELIYGHLESVLVKVGDKVNVKQQIGTMGNTGFVISGSTPYWGNAPAGKGVHLHFGVRPMTYQKTDKAWGTFENKTLYIINYQNGFHGCINPFLFLDVPEDIEKAVQTIAGLVVALKKKIEEFLKGRNS